MFIPLSLADLVIIVFLDVNVSTAVESVYSTILSKYDLFDAVFLCQALYKAYEPIQIKVTQAGRYIFVSNSTANLHGSIYKDIFDPMNSTMNLYEQNIAGCLYSHFRIIAYLQTNTKYILIVSTSSVDMKEKFSIHAYGPNQVFFSHMSESFF